MQHVTIVGAGLAGMTASLRLLERGFHVTLYEQDDFLGGMMRSYLDEEVTGTRREHSYHMFTNFYFNFWTIAQELGLQNNFVPRDAFLMLTNKDLKDLPGVTNPGGMQQILQNLSSYAVSPPDLFIYMYSMIDMLAEPAEKRDLLHKISVNGFLHSRPYMTDAAAQLHQTLWETVWAISSYQASLQSYRTFIAYTNRYSVPQMWLLAGNKWDYLMKPWYEKLASFGSRFKLHKKHCLTEIVPGTDNRIAKLKFVQTNGSPSVDPNWQAGKVKTVNVADQEVIIATTPGAISGLVHGELLAMAPELGLIKYLEAEPMGAMQLYLNRRIPNVPDNVTDFKYAPYYMTFLDYTDLWPNQHKTFMYVTCSDVKSLLGLEVERRDGDGNVIFDIDNPQTASDHIMREVIRYMPIELDDVDLRRTAFEMNTGEQLFANMVGSWQYRPETKTSIENLWLAGTYVRNLMDVATIEGGVITGLQAAEGIRQRHNPTSDPIKIIEPEAFPRELFQALKIAWAPLVASAKLWSESNRFMGRFGDGWERMQKKLIQGAARAIEPLLGRSPDLPDYLGPLNWQFGAVNLPENDPRRVGPIYWSYNRDGFRNGATQTSKMEPSTETEVAAQSAEEAAAIAELMGQTQPTSPPKRRRKSGSSKPG